MISKDNEEKSKELNETWVNVDCNRQILVHSISRHCMISIRWCRLHAKGRRLLIKRREGGNGGMQGWRRREVMKHAVTLILDRNRTRVVFRLCCLGKAFSCLWKEIKSKLETKQRRKTLLTVVIFFSVAVTERRISSSFEALSIKHAAGVRARKRDADAL